MTPKPHALPDQITEDHKRQQPFPKKRKPFDAIVKGPSGSFGRPDWI
jgi:glutathione synthase/RimK-type ligase-like ATP-grasp enzyme